MVRSQLTTRWLVPDEANRFNISLAHLRAGYDAWLEATTVDLFRPISLPRPLRSLVRWRLRQAVIGDFLVACEREGLTQLSAATLRDWLIDQGVAVMMAPLYQQLQLYRMVTIGVLVLLAAAPFAGIALAQSGVPFPGLGFRS